MARLIIFDDTSSVIHAVLGLATAILKKIGLGIASATIIVVYTVYQVLEREKDVNKLGDFIEFIVGYLIGEALP